MTLPKPFHYIIYVRPPGSSTWTQHFRRDNRGIPYRSENAETANKEARTIAEHTKYCARVVLVKLPPERDERIYAMMADGDTLYVPGQG